MYDYLEIFITQGCLFQNEKILKVDQTRPTESSVELFKKYAEFFADFCNYQEGLVGEDQYIMACAVVGYTRKYMGVAIIWTHEMIVLTDCQFSQIKKVFDHIE
jgi:hypothetical protein